MEGKMFKYVQAKQFVDYLLEHYPNDLLLDTFENDNVKIIQDADKYLLVFVDYDKQVRAQSHYQSKINKLFSLVLNGNIVVEIIWDKTKPDGTPRKLLDSSEIFKTGWKPKINLEEGIKLAYNDFIQERYERSY